GLRDDVPVRLQGERPRPLSREDRDELLGAVCKRLPPLTAKELREMIEAPAPQEGRRINGEMLLWTWDAKRRQYARQADAPVLVDPDKDKQTGTIRDLLIFPSADHQFFL